MRSGGGPGAALGAIISKFKLNPLGHQVVPRPHRSICEKLYTVPRTTEPLIRSLAMPLSIAVGDAVSEGFPRREG